MDFNWKLLQIMRNVSRNSVNWVKLLRQVLAKTAVRVNIWGHLIAAENLLAGCATPWSQRGLACDSPSV